ncbi:MAG: type II toxin-antitoxin system PemK/MazF family toxin [Petrimonas sp.]|nr:type II toxin-antitoxin system PemK/MazF family toxin [Petrimonas sp.]
MAIKQFEIWIANLDPRFGTEAGKIRPVLVVQTNLLNNIHPSTLVCPITTNIKTGAKILRVHLPKGTANVKEECDVMIDQLRAIDNRRLMKKTGDLPKDIAQKVIKNIQILLSVD